MMLQVSSSPTDMAVVAAGNEPQSPSLRVLGVVGEGLVEVMARRDGVQRALGFGGDAANVCVMAARLGAATRLAGRVGQDAMGRRLLSFWRTRGVDTTSVRCDPCAPTGFYINTTRPDGTHRFTYRRDGSAGSCLDPSDLPEAFFDRLAILVVTGVTLAVSDTSARAAEHAMGRARAHGACVACVVNHRPALGSRADQLATIAHTSDVVIASREDAVAVFGTADEATLAERLMPATKEIVLTDGAQPATVTYGEGTAVQPVPRVSVSNAAGAGDALAGAYLALRLAGHPPSLGLAWGVAAASLSVREPGCAASYPDVRETHAQMRRLSPQRFVVRKSPLRA
jgi:2-dehydro-3-deoxygluconokinase